MGRILFQIEVEADAAPAMCTVVLRRGEPETGPLTPLEWTPQMRDAATTLARSVLAVPQGVRMEFKEEGIRRYYRVPERVRDGWSKV